MAGLNGRDVKVAFAKSSTWGVPASVTKQLNIRALDGWDAKPQLVTDDGFNQNFVGEGEVGDYQPTSPELAMDLRYDGNGPILLAAAMGSAANASVVSSVAASSLVAYEHVLTLATDLTKYFTFAADVGGSGAIGTQYVLEVPTAKPVGFTITVGDNGKMQIAYPLVGAKTNYDSTTNVNSTVGAAATDPLSNRVFRRHGVFRMNLQSGNTLAAANAQDVREVNITYKRPVADGDYVFGQNYIVEPDDDGFAEFTAELVFPRMTTPNTNSLVAIWPAGTKLKMDLTFSGNYINSTTKYGLLIQAPAMEILEWTTPISGHNLLRPTARAALRMATSSPSGMAFVNPMRIVVTNMNSANLLA